MPLLYKDGVPENDHPLNLVPDATEKEVARYEVDRIPLFEVYMRMAEELAKRSTTYASSHRSSTSTQDHPVACQVGSPSCLSLSLWYRS